MHLFPHSVLPDVARLQERLLSADESTVAGLYKIPFHCRNADFREQLPTDVNSIGSKPGLNGPGSSAHVSSVHLARAAGYRREIGRAHV